MDEPPSYRGLRTTLTATLALLCLTALGMAGYIANARHQQSQARAVAADQLLGDAGRAFESGDYSGALLIYNQVGQDWPVDTERGRAAQAWRLVAQSRLDAAAGRHDAAYAALQQAAGLHAIEESRLGGWLDAAQRQAAFHHALGQIEEEIRAQRFGNARETLRVWRGRASSEAEVRQLNELAARLEDQRAAASAKQVLERVDRLVSTGDKSRAIAELDDAVTRSPNRRLQDRLDQLRAEVGYEQAMVGAAVAEAAGDWDQAVTLYEQALALQRDEALEVRLKKLRSRRETRNGLELIMAGDPAAAEAALTRALGFDPENDEARAALKGIESSSQMQSFITAGDAAMASDEYDVAVQQYRNASEFGTNNALQAKLTEARVRASVAAGLAALDDGKYDDANRLITQALRLSPVDAQALDAQERLAVYGRYAGHRQAGDEARDRSDFGPAKFHYLRAQRVFDTPEIRMRLDETEYAHLVAQARAFLAAGDYAPAQGLLRIAASLRMTDEVRELLDETFKHAPLPDSDELQP